MSFFLDIFCYNKKRIWKFTLIMVLALDIGNSNVVIGLWANGRWAHVWRLPTLQQLDALLYYETHLTDLLLESGHEGGRIDRVVISSVVPALKDLFRELARHMFGKEPVIVGPEWYHLLDFQTNNPSEMGSDLFANAVAAHHHLQADCVVVDFGTALTFTTLTAQGRVQGVAIAPGLKTAMSALFQKTAQLPEVPLELPASPLGVNTVHAIQSGVLIGYVGLVRHMLERIRGEVGDHYRSIATGGLSSILHPLQDAFDRIDPHLTLEGLRLIGEKANR